MSQLQQLKQQIVALGASARQTGQSLAQFDQTFSRQAADIESTISGSSQGKDKQMISSIEDAKRKVHDATAALAKVTQVANQYSASL